MKTIKSDDVSNDDGGHMIFGFEEGTSCFYNNSNISLKPSETSNVSAGGASSNSGVYFRWAPESIKLMLRLRFEMDREFSQRLRQKKDLWSEIAAEMCRIGGYIITGEICDLKFRNMLQTYKKNRMKEDRGMQELIIWEYYSLFKEAAIRNEANGDSLIPSMLCESVCTDDAYNETDQTVDLKETEEEAEATGAIQRRGPFTRRKLKRRASSHSATENSTGEPPDPPPHVSDQRPTNVDPQHPCIQQKEQSQSFPSIQAMQTEHHEPAVAPLENKVSVTRSSPPISPVWLTSSELSECEVFGQSVGLQLANVRDSYARSLLKLKIQELIFLATTGRLPDKYNISDLSKTGC